MNDQPIPSATVVLARDRAGCLEVLMLQKSSNINYGGTWVFPGGVIDIEDYAQAQTLFGDTSIECTAKITAARETKEEAGLTIAPESCVQFAHWTTPKLRKKRYATWFLIADVNNQLDNVVIDQGEIVDARWFTPAQALQAQASGDISLNGPAYVTLSELESMASTRKAIETYQQRGVDHYHPQGVLTASGVATLYFGDSDYQVENLNDERLANSKHPQHRLYMHDSRAWEYIKT